MERTSLPMTNAPIKTSTIDARKMIVATTRTGLNIYVARSISHDRLKQPLCGLYQFELLSELKRYVVSGHGVTGINPQVKLTPIRNPVPAKETTVPKAYSTADTSSQHQPIKRAMHAPAKLPVCPRNSRAAPRILNTKPTARLRSS